MSNLKNNKSGPSDIALGCKNIWMQVRSFVCRPSIICGRTLWTALYDVFNQICPRYLWHENASILYDCTGLWRDYCRERFSESSSRISGSVMDVVLMHRCIGLSWADRENHIDNSLTWHFSLENNFRWPSGRKNHRTELDTRQDMLLVTLYCIVLYRIVLYWLFNHKWLKQKCT